MARRNEGQLIPRGDKWIARMEWRDAQGNRKTVAKTFATQREAKQYLRELTAQRGAGTWKAPNRETLDEFLDLWSSTKQPTVEPQTWTTYEAMLEYYIRPALGKSKLTKLTAAQVQQLYADLSARGLSPRTIHYVHTVLSMALKKAVQLRLIPENPAQYVDKPKRSRQEMRALSRDEARRFLDAARYDTYGFLFTVALTTGMRPGEVLALQWKDVNWDQGTLTVQRALVRRQRSWAFKEPKTKRSRRQIPLPGTVLHNLRHWRKDQSEERLAAGAAWEDHDLIFTGNHGQPLDEHHVAQRHFQRILEQAGLPKLRLYDLRHTCATLLLAQGENPKVVSERLGHASVTLTLDTYSHVLPDMQRTATARLEAALFGE